MTKRIAVPIAALVLVLAAAAVAWGQAYPTSGPPPQYWGYLGTGAFPNNLTGGPFRVLWPMVTLNTQAGGIFDISGWARSANSASYVTMATIPIPTNTAARGRTEWVCRATAALSGGSIGDFATAAFDFEASNVAGSLAVSGPTAIDNV